VLLLVLLLVLVVVVLLLLLLLLSLVLLSGLASAACRAQKVPRLADQSTTSAARFGNARR